MEEERERERRGERRGNKQQDADLGQVFKSQSYIFLQLKREWRQCFPYQILENIGYIVNTREALQAPDSQRWGGRRLLLD